MIEDAAQTGTEEETVVVEVPAVEATVTETPAAQTDDPAAGIAALREQIANYEQRVKDAESARDDERRAREIEQRARAAAEQRAGQSHNEAADYQRRAQETQYDSVVNALAAANSQLIHHKAAYKIAFEAGEIEKLADISGEIGITASRIKTLEDGRAEIEARNRDNAVRDTRPAPQESEAEQRARWINALPPKSAAFVRSHYEKYFNDKQFASMVAGAHQLAIGRGMADGTDEYIKFIEEQTGLRKPEEPAQRTEGGAAVAAATTTPVTQPAPTSAAAATTARRSPTPAAPAAGTSAATVGNKTTRQIALTAEERSLAKTLDMSEAAYAQRKQELIDEGRIGPNAVH